MTMANNDLNGEAAVSSWNLYGWSGVVTIGMGQLNEALRNAHDVNARSPLSIETAITPGTAWLAFHGRIGAPLLGFADDGVNSRLSVRRVISQAMNLTLGKAPGWPVRSVHKVEAYDSDVTVSVESRVNECRGIYEANGSVVLNWPRTPEYRFVHNDREDPLMGAMVAESLHNKGEPIGWLGMQPRVSALMSGARLRFHIHDPLLSTSVSIYFAARHQQEGGTPGASLAGAQLDQPQDMSIPRSVLALLELDKYRGIEFDLLDLYELPCIVYPPGKLKPSKYTYTENVYHLLYMPILSAQVAPAAVQTRALRDRGINPAMMITQRGGSRIPLTLPRSASGVTLAAGSNGQVEKVDEQWYYKPAPPLNPVAIYEEESKTVPKAALKSSVDALVDVDLVSTSGSPRATSAFLIYNAVQTHYFRLSKVGEQLQLQLCFRNIKGEERVVDPDDIEWTILAGNGSISQEGIFRHGDSLSGCTAVQAIDLDDEVWYWAAIILPPLDIDELIKMQ